MMNYLDNDFLIPIILGGKEATQTARHVYNKTGIRPYIFSAGFSPEQRILFRCVKIPIASDLATLYELCSFAEKNDSRGSLLLIYTEENKYFIKDHADEIESRYITVSARELLNFTEE